MAQAKSNRAAAPWENDPVVQTEASNPWENDPIVEAPKAFSSTSIDPQLEAPPIVRAQVGALDKPEDRLTAIRKSYPDAQPYDGDNFIMTDPATGKTMIYNREGWIPSKGDFASIIPEIGEGVGSIAGAVGGGILGGTAGSIVPFAGTTAGAVGGAMAGGGTGATVGREIAQRGANWIFGNEDSRTAGEQVGDAAQTFAFNAAGEGAGILLAPVAKSIAGGVGNFVKGGPKAVLVDRAEDAAAAASRAGDFRAVGVEPTAGMVNGAPSTALREQALAPTRAGRNIQDRISQAFTAQDNEFNRIVNGLTPETLSRQELGQALKDQAARAKQVTTDRTNTLYDRVGSLTGDTPAQGIATREFLDRLQKERKLLGKSAALNDGTAYDALIKQAKAVTDDIGSGVNFNTLKQARTNIGTLLQDNNMSAVLKDRTSQLYEAITRDMAQTAETASPDALQAWRKANNRFRRTNQPGSIFNPKSGIDPILKAQTPEQAAEWVLQQANKGGTRLNAVRRQIERTEGGPDLWNTLTGSTVERMGITRGVDGVEAFNPTQLLKNWKNLSPEAKDALFAGTGRKQFREDLDRLARVNDAMKNYRRLDNHSNTNKAASVMSELNPFDKTTLLGAVFGGSTAGPLGAAGALAGSVAMKSVNYGARRWQAKILTSPETVRWLSQIPTAQMQKGGLKAHLGNLAKMAGETSDNALAVAINEYLREVNYAKD